MAALLVILPGCFTFPVAAEAPKVVASIQPLHSLASGVMAGVGTPRLLIRGYGSPHAYQMRPSDAAALYGADVIFWMGVPLENFLNKPLANVGPSARVVSLLDSAELELLPNRESGVFGHDHALETDHVRAPQGPNARDPHAWLSPENARRMAGAMAEALAAADPPNADRYRQNARTLSERISAAEKRIDQILAPVRHQPFILFHDAFQYFERAFGLSGAGALHLEPARVPGAGRVKALRQVIAERGARCIFREPQFQSALVDTLAEDLEVKVAVLDPLGADLPSSPGAWFEMMENNAKAMAECLGAG